MFNNIKTLIFDLDGTLVEFPKGQFNDSELSKKITNNSINYLSKLFDYSEKESIYLINIIQKEFGEELSDGVEKYFGIKRKEFLNNVWDIKDEGLVNYDLTLKELLLDLKSRYQIFLISDAPKVWIDFVLKTISLEKIFNKRIFSGEGKYRKSLGNAFPFFISQTKNNPKECISIGDQESTDIVPAKNIGMRTVLISKNKKNSFADIVVNKISEIKKYI